MATVPQAVIFCKKLNNLIKLEGEFEAVSRDLEQRFNKLFFLEIQEWDKGLAPCM